MAIPPVVVEFLAKGIPDVQRAFRSVQQTFEQGERIQTRAAESGARARLKAASSENRQKEKEFAKVAREAERWERQQVREAEKAAKAKTRAEEQAAREKVRLMLKSDADTKRIQERAARDAVREFSRAEREKDREAMKWLRKREAEEKASFHRREQFAKTLTGAAGRAGRTVLGGVQRLGAGILQVGGGFSVADSVQREVGLRGQAAQLAASSVGQFNADQILGQARAIGAKQALDPEKVIEGFTKIKDLTGDLNQAMRVMPGVAKLATATGGDPAELAELAGNVLMANPKLSDNALQDQLRVFARQGQVGGVEVQHMAKYGARLTAGASLFGGDKAENLATMGALTQVSRQFGGAASPAEAVIAAQRFATDVQKHAGDLEKSGIKVSDGKGGLRDAKAIMQDMLTKSGGDVTKLTKFGLGERGIRALTGFSSIYREAGGGEAGKQAVMREFQKYTTGVSEGDVEAANKKRLGEVDAQLTVAMNDLRAAVGTQLVPELVKVIPILRDLIPHFTRLMQGVIKIADWALSNPLAGLGAAIMALITKEIIAAQISQTIQKLIAGAAPGGGGAARAAAGGGVAGKAVGLGLGAAAVIANSELGYEGGKEAALDIAAKVRAWKAGDRERGMSPEAAAAQVDAAKQRLAKHGGTLEQTGNLLLSPFVEGANKDYKQYKSDQGLTDDKELKNLLREIAVNTKAAAAQGGTSAGGGSTDVANRTQNIAQRTAK